MRKLFVLPIVFASILANFGAFGATARSGRSVASTLGAADNAAGTEQKTDATSAVTARVANRNRVKQTTTAAPAAATSARVATRNAARGATPKTTIVQTTNKTAGVAARSATKQKAINLGTKVATAEENTIIPAECQTAFYGCMDSLCMMENTSGGRCRCDDRSKDLDSVLDQIQKLDAQSKILAQQGVERLELGKDVDAIFAMASEAADKVLADQKKNEKDLLNTKSKKTLDLSVFDNTGIFDTDDIFDSGDDMFTTGITDKTGSALRNSANKMCATKLPQQCHDYSSMLQLVYAQKIKSDCVAYENDLKKQKINSENLLQTAQKAVRDAAVEAYNKTNKYKTVGECVSAYKQCMTGEDVCGSGFSKCVVNKMVVAKTSRKPHKIKNGKTTIEIEEATYGALNANKEFCESVLNQCENVRSQVWDAFLISVAPELRSAEYVAEADVRHNCVRNVVDCIKSAAEGEGFQEGSDRWFTFTTNPDNVEHVCEMELEQCEAYDTNLKTSILSAVNMELNALRADRCTTTIRKLLQEACGKDYMKCVGMGPLQLRAFLPNDAIEMDCAGKKFDDNVLGFYYGNGLDITGCNSTENDLLPNCSLYKLYKKIGGSDLNVYIWTIAQGLFMEIGNSYVTGCQSAVEAAAQNIDVENTDFTSILRENVNYKILRDGDTSKDTVAEITTADLEKTGGCWHAEIQDQLAPVNPGISYDTSNTTKVFSSTGTNSSYNVSEKLESAYKFLVNNIESDTTVYRCMKANNGALGNLTSNVKDVIAQSVLNKYLTQYNEYVDTLKTEVATANTQINTLYANAGITDCASAESVADADANGTGACTIGNCDSCSDAEHKCKCIAKTYFQYTHVRHDDWDENHFEVAMLGSDIASYNSTSKECSFKFKRFRTCKQDSSASNASHFKCSNNDDHVRVSFTLDKDDTVSLDATGNATGCSTYTDYDSNFTSVLSIGDNAKICFRACTTQVYPYEGLKHEWHPLKKADGTEFWCRLSDSDVGYLLSNINGVTITEPSGKGGFDHSNQKYYGDNDW